jgi:hypothetical protein
MRIAPVLSSMPRVSGKFTQATSGSGRMSGRPKSPHTRAPLSAMMRGSVVNESVLRGPMWMNSATTPPLFHGLPLGQMDALVRSPSGYSRRIVSTWPM